MNHARTTALGLTALAFGACSYPAFQYTDESSSSATSSSSTTGAGGMSGASSSSASSGGAGGGVVPCMTMPPGGGDCEYTPGKECGCPATQKCTIDDLKTGHTKCIDHANLTPWTQCNDDSDCAAGLWCDIWTYNICRPICSNVGQCAAGARCVPTSSDAGQFTAIPGLKVCTAHCNPETTDPCPSGVTCVNDSQDMDLDCMTSGGNALNVICNDSHDCDKGLICIVGLPPTCRKWCHPANGAINAGCPPNAQKCQPLAVTVNYNGSTYGYCSP